MLRRAGIQSIHCHFLFAVKGRSMFGLGPSPAQPLWLSTGTTSPQNDTFNSRHKLPRSFIDEPFRALSAREARQMAFCVWEVHSLIRHTTCRFFNERRPLPRPMHVTVTKHTTLLYAPSNDPATADSFFRTLTLTSAVCCCRSSTSAMAASAATAPSSVTCVAPICSPSATTV